MGNRILCGLAGLVFVLVTGCADQSTNANSGGSGSSLATGATASQQGSSYKAGLIPDWQPNDSSCSAFGALQCNGYCDYRCRNNTCKIPGLPVGMEHPDANQVCYGGTVTPDQWPTDYRGNKLPVDDELCRRWGALACDGKCTYRCNSNACKVPGLNADDNSKKQLSWGMQDCGTNPNITYPAP